MTSSNGNGHGSSLPGKNRLPLEAAAPLHLDPALPEQVAALVSEYCCPTTVALVPTATDGQAMVRPSEGMAVSGLHLPSEFNTGHFVDPAFLTGLANELYAEGRPPQAVPSTGAITEAVRVAVSQVRTGPEVGLPVFQHVDFADTHLFNPGAGMPSAPGLERAAPSSVPQPSEGTPYYFLPQTVPAETKPAPTQLSSRSFHVEAIRQDFPLLQQKIHGKPLIWLDNAATTQKPRQVIEALSRFYERDNSNIHRAAHTLAARATNLYEGARDKVRRFLGASQSEEIIFTHGATESINLVAQTYGRKYLQQGDEIVLSTIEHHANIVPWQHVAQEKGAVLRVVPVNDRGEVILEEYEKLLGPRTRFVSLTHVSNALGTVLPVRTMIQLAHRHGAKVLIDGAQSAPHLAIDVQALDADFFVLAGHKLFGPTGIGVLYAKRAMLEMMPPWQGGGNMIDQVTFEHTTYQPAPAKFEAGTGILAGAVGLAAAIDYLDEIGLENINRYEHELLAYAMEGLATVPGIRLIGTAAEKASVQSFVLEGVRNEDVGRYLDREGIAVRAGHHCAQPTMQRFGVTGTVRPSLAFYNTCEEIDVLVAALRKAKHSLT